jgi:hypothetical protein
MDCRVQPGNDDRWLVAAIYCADSRTAMSVPLNILRHVQRSLNGTQLCKDMLVVTPTEHILRGFLFERTTEKGMYYLWRVVMPLYRPANTVILNYSSRIPNATALLGDLRTSPASAAGRVEAWERANFENLGLAETVVGIVH